MGYRGSTWNIWDLHIHTPKSIKNNYGGDADSVWEAFIKALEELPEEVKAIGINDYYFIDGFEKVMDYKMNKGRLVNIEKIFPILEFRIDTFATASESRFQKINLHILFNIDESHWKEEVRTIREEFISQIHVSKLKEHSTKVLSIDNLVSCTSANNLSSGFENLIPSTEEVFNLIENENWRNRTFTFLGYTEWHNLEKNEQLKIFKESLYNRVDAFFTASPEDKINKKQEVLDRFGDKVLIHSMDIHSFNDFNKDLYNCYTWIKADLSFEGLKQVTFEPYERIRIQRNSPYSTENKTNVINKIQILNSQSWFEDKEILLNSGMISIIGEKGSGKTALLDLLAISNEEGIFEYDIKSPTSFYNRAKAKLTGTTINFKYVGNDEQQSYTIYGQPIRNESNSYAKVRYLSLKELESYCDKNEKLQSFIREIIHSKSNEVMSFSTQSKDIINQIQNINSRIKELEDSLINGDNIVNAKANKENELKLHLNNEPKMKTDFMPDQDEKYKELLSKEQQCLAELKELEVLNDSISDFERWLNSQVGNIESSFGNNLVSKISSYNIIGKELQNIKLKVSFEGIEIIDTLKKNNAQRENEINSELLSISEELNPLKESLQNFENEKNTYQSWLTRKIEIENGIKNLEFEVNKIEDNRLQIIELQNQRKNEYVKLIDIKNSQVQKYNELKSAFESEENIKFEVRYIFNENLFFQRENDIINHGSGNSQEVIQTKLRELILSKIYEPDEGKTVADALDCINDASFIPTVFGTNKDKTSILKKSFSIKDFYDWLFNDYFEVNYLIMYKGKHLEALSPGQKGLVLMKIFLKLDNSSKPLLIDQPEDNLDNKSVYNDLVKDFREIKKRRQIIIATHNPNLVVNTDCEQVIVATFEDSQENSSAKIRYQAGSLENKDIRNLVCEILEGGSEAFEKREKRYSI